MTWTLKCTKNPLDSHCELKLMKVIRCVNCFFKHGPVMLSYNLGSGTQDYDTVKYINATKDFKTRQHPNEGNYTS